MPNPFLHRHVLPALLGIALGVIGCLVGIYLPIRGPFGLDFVVGSAIAYFYLQFDRRSWGPYLTTAIIGASTWVLWGHPYAAAILMAEFVCVAMFMRRLNALAVLALFWMTVGPLLVGLFYGQMLHMSSEIWLIISIKQAMNGILCVATGTFFATFLRLTLSRVPFVRPISVIGFATSGMLPFVLIPTILITFENARQQAETQLALHAVAWSQFADDLAEAALDQQTALTSASLNAALRRESRTMEGFAEFSPMRIEVIEADGTIVSTCTPTCPAQPDADQGRGTLTAVGEVPGTMLYLPPRGSLMQRWRDGSLITTLTAQPARPKIRAITSLKMMVDRSFLEIRQDFYLLISAVSLVMAVGAILYSRVVQPFRDMASALDSWHSYDFTVPQLPSQKFIEIERFRLLIERVSQSLAGERDRSIELQQQLNTIAQQSPMIFASWLVTRRFGSPLLEYVSAHPEDRLMIGSDLFSRPVRALPRVHPEDRIVLRRMLGQLVSVHHCGAEIRVMGIDSQWRWILCRLSSRTTPAGLNENIGVFTDITELNSMRELLGQEKGITLVGRMVAGLAHELNQPLNVISMAADNLLHFLARHAGALGEHLPYLQDKSEKILQQVHRAGGLLGTVEGLANQTSVMDGTHNLKDILASSMELVAPLTATRHVQIHSHIPEIPLMIRGGRSDLVECFAAIIRNAVEAATTQPDGGVGDIRLTVSHYSKIAKAKIEVSDNGPGIDPDILPYLFSPFQSIKATAEGAGLSLARCFNVIQSCGGEVYARNNLAGATITVYLPLA